MREARFCKDCKRKVTAKRVNGILLTLLILAGLLLAPVGVGYVILIFSIAYMIFAVPKCPISNGKNWGKK